MLQMYVVDILSSSHIITFTVPYFVHCCLQILRAPDHQEIHQFLNNQIGCGGCWGRLPPVSNECSDATMLPSLNDQYPELWDEGK